MSESNAQAHHHSFSNLVWPADAIDRLLRVGGVVATIGLIVGAFGAHASLSLAFSAAIGVVTIWFGLFHFHRQNRHDQAAHAALQDVEARMGGIIESAMDAIITVDEKQRIVQFNAAAEAMFGYTREKAMGASIDWFIPHRHRATHASHVEQFGKAGVSSRRMGAERIIVALRANGEEFPVDASISQTTEHGAKFYTVILRDVTERVKAESDLRRSKAELGEFASAAHTVREQEKSRIARELHDELGQALTALKMDVGWLRGHVPEDSGLVRDKLERMEALLNNTVTATRRISSELRPLILDDLGVIAATESLVDSFTQRTGIVCDLVVSDPELSWRDPLATAIFRIVQESLTNISRHAKASHASVEISQNDIAVVLIIRDDGIGFAMDEPPKPNSFGLMGLRERAYLLGGDAHVSSRPGQGTRVEVSLPLTQQQGPA